METLHADGVVGKAARVPLDHSARKRNREDFDALWSYGFSIAIVYPPGMRGDGKSPMGEAWGFSGRDLQKLKGRIGHINRQGFEASFGAILGPETFNPYGLCSEWRHLIDLEGDGPQAEASREILFGGEDVATRGFSSVRGEHRFYLVDTDRLLPIFARMKGAEVKDQPGAFKLEAFLPDLEFRIGGYKPDGVRKQIQSVVPPSIGSDGKTRREWNGVEHVAELPEYVYAILEEIAASMEEAEAAKAAPPPPQPAAPSPWRVEIPRPADRVDAYLRGTLKRQSDAVAAAVEPNRHKTLLARARMCAGYLHYNCGFTEAELTTTMMDAAKQAEPNRTDHDRTIADAIAHGKLSPVQLPDELHQLATTGRIVTPSHNGVNGHAEVNGYHHANGHANGKPAAEAADLAARSDEDLGIHRADAMDPERIEWMWDGRIGKGKINLLGGNGGGGKSQLSIRVVASITTGNTLPDGSSPSVTGPCLILAAEDGARDTIVPRLIAAGADRARVNILTAKVTTPRKDGPPLVNFMSFQDLDYWREVFRRTGAVLLVVDPLPAYLGRGVNDHRNNEVRAVLEPFGQLLEETGVGLLAVTHFNKNVDTKTPEHRIIGSVAYKDIARTLHVICADPDEPERRRLCHIKHNNTASKPTLCFKVEPHNFTHKGVEIETSRLAFEDKPLELTGAEAASGKPARGGGERTVKVATWLYDFLAKQPSPTPLGAIFDAAGNAGLLGDKRPDGRWNSHALLYQAKDYVPSLDGERAGKRVDDLKTSIRDGGRAVVHWYMVAADSAF